LQNLFLEVASLDKRCYDEFFLTEDILMEHAASGMQSYIENNFAYGSSVIVVVGSGNNGADGIALARLLHKNYKVSIYYAKETKSPMAQLQKKRALAIGVKQTTTLYNCDVLVDAIVGTGFKGEFNQELQDVLEQMNTLKAFKIACDTPSGNLFYADVTLTMGGLKIDQFLDNVKDFIGEIKVVDLGITREIYEKESNYKLLDETDFKPPFRTQEDVHKGSFGHLSVVVGQMQGAAILSGLAALHFGCGLVTLCGEVQNLPYSLMQKTTLPNNTTAIALGMGLGEQNIEKFIKHNIPIIADADIFHSLYLEKLLKKKNLVLTPHPKEFVTLLKKLNLADITIEELQQKRFKYVELFAQHYPKTTLLLKGANVIITYKNKFFVNPHGSNKLAKGGSGDVLSGLIGSLLAQGYSPLEAAIQASLAHTTAAKLYSGADFSLTAEGLIQILTKIS